VLLRVFKGSGVCLWVHALEKNERPTVIAKLRTAKGLKQSEITGLSERQVRRIEKGEGTTYESLRRLAAAHDMDTSDYLRKIAETLTDIDSSHGEHRHKQLVTA
jgi:transcriptional regulator with XRE-family HTH domain